MRISRKCYNSQFFHVMVQGINKEKIFNENCLKSTFINYMKNAAQIEKTKIVAYCVMDNHAHILIYTDEIRNISKMMHSLNTRYAMKYNKTKERCGFVFRNRYRCENIYDISYLKNCIRYIHNNPVKAGICKEQRAYYYSSYHEYLSGKIDISLINEIFGEGVEYIFELNKVIDDEKVFIDIDNEFENNVYETPEKIINDFYSENKIVPQYISNKELSQLIKILINKCGLTQVKIGELLGIDRNKIYRLLKRFG